MVFGMEILGISNSMVDGVTNSSLSVLLLNLFFIFQITKMIIINGKCDTNAIANN